MTDFFKRHKRVPALVAAGLLLAASATLHAAPVSFGISVVTITPGTGYGDDGANENGNNGTLLDVRFADAFQGLTFSLDHVGDKKTFDLARITFSELNSGNGANEGIRGGETDNLGVSFTFTGPLGNLLTLTAAGTATSGPIIDPEVDYVISWTPLEGELAAGGRFRLSVNDLSFSRTGEWHTAQATLELLAEPGVQAAEVPEPASLALVGIALAGAGLARRRRKA